MAWKMFSLQIDPFSKLDFSPVNLYIKYQDGVQTKYISFIIFLFYVDFSIEKKILKKIV